MIIKKIVSIFFLFFTLISTIYGIYPLYKNDYSIVAIALIDELQTNLQDNYYNISQIDELLNNITINATVNLTNYYTKNETYNKSEVYNKTEVNNLILNVTGFNLTNYYTKDETYNITEIDSRIHWTVSGANLYPANISKKVGIGTSTPDFPLNVESSTSIAHNQLVGFYATNLLDTQAVRMRLGRTGGIDVYFDYHYDTTPADRRMDFGHGGGDVQMSLLQGGNFGIGIKNPQNKLEIDGDLNLLEGHAYKINNKTILNESTLNITGTVFASNISGHSPLQLQTGGTTRIYINDSTGNVGIGTINPSGRLQIDNITIDTNIISSTNTNGSIILLPEGSGGVGVGNVTDAEMSNNLFKIKNNYTDNIDQTETGTNSQSTFSTWGIVWQSFTPSSSGHLTRVAMLRSSFPPESAGSVIGTVDIYTGEGTGGTLMGSGSFSTSAWGTWIPMVLANPIYLKNETKYTFDVQITGGTGTFYFKFQNPGSYTRGRASATAARDLTFRTYMSTDYLLLSSRMDTGRFGLNNHDPQATLHVSGDVIIEEKVGIGTTNPSHKLNVIGSANFTGDVFVNGSLIGSSPLEVREGVDFTNASGNPLFRFYKAKFGEDTSNVPSDFDDTFIIETEHINNPYDIEVCFYDNQDQTMLVCIPEEVNQKVFTVRGGIQIVGNSTLKANNRSFVDCEGNNFIDCINDLLVEDDIEAKSDIFAQGNINISGAYYGNGSGLTDIGATNIVPDSIDGTELADTITLDSVMNIIGGFNFSINTNDLFVDMSTGRVGIGTTTPTEKLHLDEGTFLQTPGNPTIIGSYSSGANMNDAENVDVVGKYAYVTAMTSDSLTILDISDPANPLFVGKLSDSNNLNGATGVHVTGSYAYISNQNKNSLAIIDVSNPSAPTLVGNLTGINTPVDLYVSGKYAYVTASGTDRLYIIDISDPSNPTTVGTVTNSTYMDFATGIYVNGKYAYVSGYSSDSLAIIDISDPSNPSVVGGLNDSTNMWRPWGVYSDGRYAYVAGYLSDSLAVIDISEPTNPTLVGSLLDSTNLNGAQFVKVSGKYAYVTGYVSNSLAIIDISDPTNLSVVGKKGSMTGAVGLDISGKYAYVVCLSLDSLFILDIAGIDSPTASIGTISTSILDISENAQIGNDLYVGNGLTVGSGGIYSKGSVSFDNRTLITDGAGNVGIGFNSPNYKLEIDGSIGINNATADKIGGGTWGTYSDKRLKKNITILREGLDIINQIKTYTYQWRNPEQHGNINRTVAGFISEEIKKVFPNWVSTAKVRGKDALLVENQTAETITLPMEYFAYITKSIQELDHNQQLLINETNLLKKQLKNLKNKTK